MQAADWQQLRSQFPVTRHWAFFDHAAVAPPSQPARDALIEWAQDLAVNGGVSERRWLNRIETVRQLAGKLIGADPVDIAFIKNTSEGIGIIAEGFPFKPGDNVVTAEEEYPSNIYPWMNLARRGVELRRVASSNSCLALDDIKRAMDGRTRLLSLSFVEFASGFRNHLDDLAAMCSERGVAFFVDAIQGLGVLPVDVQKTPISFLAADGHKWLLGPEGAGLLYVRRDWIERLAPVNIGWNSVIGARNFSQIDFRLKPHAGRYESGSLNVGGISALGASIELLLGIGIANVRDRVLELTDLVCARAEENGMKVFSSRAVADKSGIVSLCVPKGQASRIVRTCREQQNVINHRSGRLRVSPHFYNTIEEVEYLMKMLPGQF